MKPSIKILFFGLFSLIFFPALVSAQNFLSPYRCTWELKLFLESGAMVDFGRLLGEEQKKQPSKMVRVCDIKKCQVNSYVDKCPPCPYYVTTTIPRKLTKKEKEAMIRAKLNEMNLSHKDIDVIVGFVMNGYSVQEQTIKEYKEFLSYVDKINADSFSCYIFKAVAHKGRWTGAIGEFNKNNKKKRGCPKLAGGESVIRKNVIWNDLKQSKIKQNGTGRSKSYYVHIALAIVGIIVLIFILFLS